MAQKTDIAWKPIFYVSGAAIGGILIGTFLIAPMLEKAKMKKLAQAKEKPVSKAMKKA